MKKFIATILCCLIFITGAFAQIVPNQQQDEIKMAEAGVFFSSTMQEKNISQNDISFLRRQNKPFEVSLNLANNSGVPLSFVAYISHINQIDGSFGSASILPDTEMYLVTEEDAQSPSVLLKRLAQKNYGDEIFFDVIARFNSLRKEYTLPEEIFIPRVKQRTVQDNELLSDIAKSFYNDEAKVGFLARANGIPKPYQMFNGQIILIPEISGEADSVVIQSDSYKVSKGDTAKSIAEKFYGIDGAISGELMLVWHNVLQKKYVISAKQVLAIPALLEKYQAQEADSWESISTKYYSDESGSRLLEKLNQKLSVGQEVFVSKTLKPEFSCAGWISVKEKSFVLKPREGREIVFQVNLPRGGNLAGTYSAMLTLEQQSVTDTSDGIRTALYSAYNSILILNIESRRPLAELGELHSFEVKRKGNFVGVVFGLKNLGKTQIQVRRSEVRVLRGDRSLVFGPKPLGAG